MRYSELLEAKDPILKLLKKCKEKYGQSLMGGNCGTYALALSEWLKNNNNINSNLVIFCDYEPTNNIVSLNDIINFEADVYHIAVQIGSKIYDGDGEVSIDSILRWVSEEYNDDNVFVHSFPSTDSKWITLINNDTDWTISSNKFLKFMTLKK